MTTIRTHERETHFEGHLEGIFAKVAKYGYNGVMVSQRTLSPILNPFALHDPNLPATERLFSYLGGIVYGRDEGVRLRAYVIQEKKLKGQMFCPASESSGTDHVLCLFNEPMDAAELADHMGEIHGVEYRKEVKKCKPLTKKKETNSGGFKPRQNVEKRKFATKRKEYDSHEFEPSQEIEECGPAIEGNEDDADDVELRQKITRRKPAIKTRNEVDEVETRQKTKKCKPITSEPKRPFKDCTNNMRITIFFKKQE
ncbi:hypothetical protein EMCG_09140 [[Emmonsia] crescens]|uniref:Uncharacterized protein n=1 Tax=[Emmonsia] crescens TaxID=73230 RepID=A0A0G2J3F8_9EURO|nr:hypothetical protein EMCG_09140 [Emmonsia crescens UAMH 3008]